MIRDVITPIAHWTSIERRNPRRVDPQCVRQIVELRDDAGQLTKAVTVRIRETQWVDLIEDSLLPPKDSFERLKTIGASLEPMTASAAAAYRRPILCASWAIETRRFAGSSSVFDTAL